jgi:hypothetical protein
LPGPSEPPPAPQPEPAAPAPVAPAPIDAAGPEPPGLVGAVLAQAVRQVAVVVRPDAAAAVATTFGFPLGLMVAVLGYLVAQGRIDLRDPKLRAAPQSTADTIVPFVEEDHL